MRRAPLGLAALCLLVACSVRRAIDAGDLERIEAHDFVTKVPVYPSRRISARYVCSGRPPSERGCPPEVLVVVPQRHPGRIDAIDEHEGRRRLHVCFDEPCGETGRYVFAQSDDGTFRLRGLPSMPEREPTGAVDPRVVLEVRVRSPRDALRY